MLSGIYYLPMLPGRRPHSLARGISLFPGGQGESSAFGSLSFAGSECYDKLLLFDPDSEPPKFRGQRPVVKQ